MPTGNEVMARNLQKFRAGVEDGNYHLELRDDRFAVGREFKTLRCATLKTDSLPGFVVRGRGGTDAEAVADALRYVGLDALPPLPPYEDPCTNRRGGVC